MKQKSGINSCFNGYIKNSRSTAAIATLFTATATTKEPQHEGNNNKATTLAVTVEAEKNRNVSGCFKGSISKSVRKTTTALARQQQHHY